MELIHKNILPVHCSIKQAIIGESGQDLDPPLYVMYTPVGSLSNIWTPSRTVYSDCFLVLLAPPTIMSMGGANPPTGKTSLTLNKQDLSNCICGEERLI